MGLARTRLVICLLIACSTLARAQGDCPVDTSTVFKTLIPAELIGVWKGLAATANSTIFSQGWFQQSGAAVFINTPTENDLESASLEDMYSLHVVQYRCIGPGEAIRLGYYQGLGYECAWFKRDGDALINTWGQLSETTEGVVCPSAYDAPLDEPGVAGRNELEAVADVLPPEEWTCQE